MSVVRAEGTPIGHLQAGEYEEMESKSYEFVDQRGNRTTFGFFAINGVVLQGKVDRQIISDVQSSKDLSTRETKITTTHREKVRSSFILKLDDGSERDFDLEIDMAMRESHRLSVICIRKIGDQDGSVFAVFNATLNKLFFSKNPVYPAKSRGWGIVAFSLGIISLIPVSAVLEDILLYLWAFIAVIVIPGYLGAKKPTIEEIVKTAFNEYVEDLKRSLPRNAKESEPKV